MSTTAYEQPSKVSEVAVREPRDSTRTRWVNRARSADHKVIATTMIGFSLIALTLAGISELMCWGQLALQDNTFLSPESFYNLHSLSDTTYLYLFALPLFAGLATYALPLQIGARSSAFPRLSALGAWMIVLGGFVLYLSTFVNTWQGGAQVSSSFLTFFYSPSPGIDFWLATAVLVGGGLTFNAIDLAVTYKVLRAEGMTSEKSPVFAYASAVYAYGILATAPVLVAASIMALVERQWELFGIFDPVNGGNTLLWKTLFQWFSHSAPYLITVVALGIVSEIIAAASGGKLANFGAVKNAIKWFAILAILGFGQVYFGAPVAPAWNYIFMVVGLALLIPSAVLIVSWVKTLQGGTFKSSVPALFAVTFIGFFTFGVVANIALSLPALSQWINGSEFGYAVWLNGVWSTAAFAGFAGLTYWFPKMTGRSLDAFKAKLALGMMAVGTVIALLAMCSLGVDGFARELYTYSGGFQARNIEAGLGTLLAAFGAIGLLINLMQSSTKGAVAGNDPWHAGTLEWFAQSPPPANNFDSVPAVESDAPLKDLRSRIADDTGKLAGSVAQSPTAGRPSLRESKH
ncbi:MAG: cytochrome c oxidase subunit I [Solirubrobacterales bacterium]